MMEKLRYTTVANLKPGECFIHPNFDYKESLQIVLVSVEENKAAVATENATVLEFSVKSERINLRHWKSGADAIVIPRGAIPDEYFQTIKEFFEPIFVKNEEATDE